ncbi:MAG: peptide ligase PGM1-related protein [Candidatus Limnocylindria bacterium]
MRCWLPVASSRARSSSSRAAPGWIGLDPATVIGTVAVAGLQFDPLSGSGVVLHMLSGLGIDGRMGLTAIAETHADAASMQTATRDVIGALADSRA